MKQMLEESLGIWRVVEKRRDLFLFDEIRIHLDRVQRLGNFLELEGVVSDPRRALEIREKVNKLICHFQISTADLIAGSYSDLN
ncbi:CYTH domain-containing protein [candidate division KSB1 bacterium]|nr:CYTH domain-containing protein [candidate division KSB1 bacterium]